MSLLYPQVTLTTFIAIDVCRELLLVGSIYEFCAFFNNSLLNVFFYKYLYSLLLLPELDFSNRVEHALDADTERMYAECHAYREAVRDDKARIKGWRQAVQGLQPAGATPHPSSGNNSSNNEEGEEVLSPANSRDSLVASLPEQQSCMEDAFRNEIALLEEACQQQREELLNFRDLQREQKRLEIELDRVHEAMAHEQNALELEARAFDNDQEQLSRALLEIQDEVERLTSPKLKLPATLLHLQVDRERGLRYPLINELRLAYRPKGDVQWNEIQAAWALAAQLLLSIGTIFQFQSCDWKLVPLSRCAKIFYYPPTRINNNNNSTGANAAAATASNNKPVVVNLGHPKTNNQNKALLTWNALLCQVIQHISSELAMAVQLGILDAEEVPPVPFEITPTKIGNTSLTQLKEDDDGGWSRVIHFMASDLLWLSDCASTFVRQQVVLENHTMTVCSGTTTAASGVD